MKSVSNHSYAKTVHTLKSIGKVLLPVALLLAAILCIGVAAGAVDTSDEVTYVLIPGTSTHVKVTNGVAETENCYYAGPDCTTTGPCVCGRTGMQNPNPVEAHTNDKVVAPQYLKTAGKCVATSTYYMSCSKCGATLTDTFKPGDGYHSYTVEKVDAKYLVNVPVCNMPKEYYKSCACGASSEGDTNEKFATTATWPHTLAVYNGETDAELPNGLKVKDLLVKAATCSEAGVYHDYCSVCGAVLASTSTYGSAAHDYKVYSNATSHWSACQICGAVKADTAAAHVYDKDAKATCTEAVTCSVCNYVITPKLAHDLVHTAEKPATCIATGLKEYWTCQSCKTMFSDAKATKVIDAPAVIAALGHLVDETAPACNPGKCLREGCDETIKATVGHTYSADDYVGGKTSNKLLCTAACDVCGVQYDAKGHTYKTVVVTAATCTEKGKQQDVCSKCGDIINKKDIAPKGHKFDTTALCLTSATCKVCGEVVENNHVLPDSFNPDTFKCTDSVRCVRCGAELAGYYSHERVAITAKAATCTEDGTTAGYKCDCTVVINGVTYSCKYQEGGATIPKTGHKWSAWKVTTAPTCQADGVETRTCSVCKATETRKVDKTPDTHKWSEDYKMSTDKHWQYCTVEGCTAVNNLDVHAYQIYKDGKWVDSDGATCLRNGVCKVCGFTVAASGTHPDGKYTWVKNDTEHYKVCKSCGEVIDGSKAAHTLKDVAKKDATCGADGYAAHKECECGWSNQTWTVYKATGKHKFTNWDWCDKDDKYGKVNNSDKNTKYQYNYRYCTVCHKFESHKAVSDAKQDCLTDNHCKTCGLIMKNTSGKQTGKALGHDFKTSETVVTADAHSWTCSRCYLIASEKHVSDAKAACLDGACKVCGVAMKATAKHTPSDDIKSNASGHSYVCTVCNSTITAEGHRVNEALNDCTKGLKCSVCGYEIMAPQEAHAFDLENVIPAVPATCTEDGHTAYYKCKNCSVTTVQAVIKATGHKWVDVAAKPATETEDGYTAHKACSVCGEKDESYKVIPKLGGDVRDVNGDGKFTSDDAIALLYLTFGNPDIKYDFNGDGKVTSDDAVTLLYMSF